jgi:hypothetical protein
MDTPANHSDALSPASKARSIGPAAADAINPVSEQSQIAERVTTRPATRRKAKAGCAKGPGFYMAPDFDAPLEEFKDYM